MLVSECPAVSKNRSLHPLTADSTEADSFSSYLSDLIPERAQISRYSQYPRVFQPEGLARDELRRGMWS